MTFLLGLGLMAKHQRTLDSLARVYGVSYECIRQIEKCALAILKSELTGADAFRPKGK
jgi:DNA-directed RNA polymerase sigma subunit (sigma70/sigma32)